MDLEDLQRFGFVDRQQPLIPHFWAPSTPRTTSQGGSQDTVRPVNTRKRRGNDDDGNNENYGLPHDERSELGRGGDSLSPQLTAVPLAAPTPPWQSTSTLSHPDQYGFTRIFGYPCIDNRPFNQAPQAQSLSPSLMKSSSPVRFDPATMSLGESRAAMDEVAGQAQAVNFRDPLATAAQESITPGYDDGPFYTYALDALTAERWPTRSSVSSVPSRTGLTAQGVPYGLPHDYYDFEEEEAARLSHEVPRGAALAGPHLGLPFVPRVAPMPSVAGPAPAPDQAHESAGSAPRPASSPATSPDYHPEAPKPAPWMKLEAYNTTPPLSPLVQRLHPSEDPESWDKSPLIPISETAPFARDGRSKMDVIDPGRRKYPRSDYLPRLLRPLSMILLMNLCLIMTVLFMLSAIFSIRRPGLLAFGENPDDGSYFLFRVLPQMLAAGVFLYTQCITITTTRIMPFAQMANDRWEERRGALFEPLYPRSFWFPHLAGPPLIKACCAVFWLSAFTIPLASSAFTVANVGGRWVWTSVQPVTWLLVALYLLLFIATGTSAIFWYGRHTGLLWDPRSIADIARLLYKSNTLGDDHGTELMEDDKQIRSKLRRRHHDRLGYWHSKDPSTDAWYGIGVANDKPSTTTNDPRRDFKEEKDKDYDHDNEAVQLPDETDEEHAYRSSSQDTKLVKPPSNLENHAEDNQVRARFLPRSLRLAYLAPYAVIVAAFFAIVVALSFMRGAAWLHEGFIPGDLAVYSSSPLPSAAFSPAQFVYSFIPSLLSMFFYLALRSLDQSLRILQPWAELNRHDGSPVRRSLLLDYAACSSSPHAAIQAALNGHWRVAATSLAAFVSIFIPVLAGGLFVAGNLVGDGNTGDSDSNARIYPRRPILYILLVLLALYLIVIAASIPGRSRHRLPHGVTTLASIISFLNTSDVKEEKAFSFSLARKKATMLMMLAPSRQQDEDRWRLGSDGPAGWGQGEISSKLGVRKVKKFTERKARRSLRSTSFPAHAQSHGLSEYALREV